MMNATLLLKIYILLELFLLTCGCKATASSAEYNLEQLLRLGQQSNLELQISSQDLQIRLLEMKELLAAKNLKVGSTAEWQRQNLMDPDETDGNRIKVNVNAGLGVGISETLDYQLKNKQLDIEKARIVCQAKNSELVYEIKREFYYYITLNEIAKLNSQKWQLLNNRLAEAREHLKTGDFSLANINWLKIKKTSASTDVLDTQRQLSDSLLQIKRLCGVELDAEIRLDIRDVKAKGETDGTRANADSPEARLTWLDIQKNELELRHLTAEDQQKNLWAGLQYSRTDLGLFGSVNSNHELNMDAEINRRFGETPPSFTPGIIYKAGIQFKLLPVNDSRADTITQTLKNKKLYYQLNQRETQQALRMDKLRLLSLKKAIKENLEMETDLASFMQDGPLPFQTAWYQYQSLIDMRLEYYSRIAVRKWQEYEVFRTCAHIEFLEKGYRD